MPRSSLFLANCVLALTLAFSLAIRFGHAQENDPQDIAFEPHRAIVIQASSATDDDIETVVGEIVDVVKVRPDESRIIDETGNSRWVASKTLSNLHGAFDELKRKLIDQPTDRDLLYSMCVLLNEQSRLPQALQYSDQLIQHHPDYINGYLNRSQILTGLKRYEDAIDACNQCLQREPSSSVALVNRGLAYAELGKLDQALEDYGKSLRIDNNIMALNNRAAIYLQRGDFDKAITAFTDALDVKKFDRLYHGRAKALAAIGKEDEALKDYAAAIELNPGNDANYLARARHLFGKDNQAALGDFKRAVELAPDNPFALTDYGAAMAMAGNYVDAEKHLTRAISIVPENALANANLAFVLVNQRKYQAAIQYAKRAIDSDSDLEIAHSNLATSLSKLGRIEESIAAFTEAIRLNPKKLSLRNDRGLEYLKAKKFDLATKDIRACLDANPKRGIYWTNLSRIQQEQGQIDAAMKSLGTSIEVEPKYDIAFYRRGLLYLDNLKEAKNAARDLEKAAQLDPSWFSAWYNLGRAKGVVGDLPGARDAYGKAIAINPRDSYPLINRSHIFIRMGEYKSAQEDAMKAVQIDPLDSDATFNLASAYYYADEFSKAAQQFSIMIGAGAESALAFNRRGDSFQELRRFQDAVSDYTSSLEISPKAPAVHHARGYSLAALGKNDEALNDYDRSLELDPSRTSTRLLRGHLNRKMHRYEEAVADYEQVSKEDPDSDLAIINLAAVLSAANTPSVRDGKRAIDLATKACEKSEWKSALPIAVLSLAQAEAGNFGEAIETAKRAQKTGQTPPWLPEAIRHFQDKLAWRFPN